MTTANVVFSGPATQVTTNKREAKVATGETILPGHLMLIDGNGEFINHNVAGEGDGVLIAEMDLIRQKSVTEALTVGENAEGYVPVPGETYNLVLADGNTIAKGDALSSNGDGTVTAATEGGATPDVIIGYAEEAVTTAGATGRIRARIATYGSKATA